MKPHPPFKTVEEVPLSAYEQSIEDAIDENAPPQTISPELLAEVQAAMAELAITLRGGKRMGAGRDPRQPPYHVAVVTGGFR
jgi:hypothetical protein